MSNLVRVRQEFIATYVGDTPENRRMAEEAFRELGATVFRHEAAYSISHDETLLCSHGFVVESV